MPSFEKKTNGTWTVRFRIRENGREINKRLTHWGDDISLPNFYTKKEAMQGYLDYQEKHRKQPLKPVYSPLEMTFGELVERYLNNLKHNAKESTFYMQKFRIEKRILTYFDSKTLIYDIKAEHIQQFQNDMTNKGFSLCYKKSVRSVLSAVFKSGELYEIYYNPVKKVPNFKNNAPRKEVQYFTEKDFQKYISVITDIRDKALFSFLYIMGTRKGETLALQWKDIDFSRKIANINKTVTKNALGNKAYKITSPKTTNSYRKLDIPDNLLVLLKELRKSAKDCPKDYFVFGGEKNMPFTTLKCKHDKYTKESGVHQIRIHDFRHSSVSYMINHGENEISAIFTIAKRLGDTTEQVYKTYGHLFPDNAKALVMKFNDIKL